MAEDRGCRACSIARALLILGSHSDPADVYQLAPQLRRLGDRVRRSHLESTLDDALDDTLWRERQDCLPERRRVCWEAAADPRHRLGGGLAARDRDEDDISAV